MDALVSVIIPVYKVEAFLDRCVESVVGQTYPKLEIILVDDGSPDTCPEKCDAWAKKDSRIKVVHKQNEGPGYARNSGIEAATGAYIMFVDSDDYLFADAVEVLLDRIERDQSDLAVAQKVKVYPDGTEEPTSDTWMHDTVKIYCLSFSTNKYLISFNCLTKPKIENEISVVLLIIWFKIS